MVVVWPYTTLHTMTTVKWLLWYLGQLARPWYMWHGYGVMGPLLWLKEGCDVLTHPCWTYNKCFITLGYNGFPHHPQHRANTHVYMLRLDKSSGCLWQDHGGVWPLLWLKDGREILPHPHWTYTKWFINLWYNGSPYITLNTTIPSHVYMGWD